MIIYGWCLGSLFGLFFYLRFVLLVASVMGLLIVLLGTLVMCFLVFEFPLVLLCFGVLVVIVSCIVYCCGLF